MAINKAYTGTKPVIDRTKTDVPFSPGIYKGIVKKVDTAARSGRLYVYIIGFGANDPNNPANWILVNYASPYMGTTTGGASISPTGYDQYNSYNYTKQTYGMFMAPPDVGNQVLCCFPNGETREGYWFACVTPNLSKHMTPANGAVPWDRIEQVSIPADLQPYLKPGTPYPAGEFNENDPRVYNSSWATQNLYPINPYLTGQLIKQGLDQDPTRGAIDSSAQRDAISSVFGVSTPGRPIPAQDPKNIPNIKDLIATGTYTQASVTSRVTGHTFVMDDGDLVGDNDLVRLKTAAGHQILMNDTDGFMYIANSNGTAWIELTKEGDVLVYGARDLAVRTSGNLMMHSDRNIMFNARGVIDMYAAAIRAETQQAILMNSQAIVAEASQAVQIKSGGAMSLEAGAAMAIKAGATMSADAALIALNSGGGGSGGGLGGALGGIQSAASKLGESVAAIGSAASFKDLAKAAYSGYKAASSLIGQAQNLAGGGSKGITQYKVPDTRFTQIGWTVVTEANQSICYRVPTHEPYVRGNIAAVIAEQEGIETQGGTATTTTVDGQTVTAPTLGASTNAESAKAQGVPTPAPTSSFIKQPAPSSGIGNLSQTETQALFAQIGYTESGSSYIPANSLQTVAGVNNLGYIGKYQLGSAALQGVGYVKPGTPQTVEALNNPNNWVGGTGKPASLEEYLNTASYQESAMYSYTKSNYATLQKTGVINASTSNEDIAGYLAGAHLAGAGGVTAWYLGGNNTADANGTTIANYFNNGRYSQTQVPVIVASTASKNIS